MADLVAAITWQGRSKRITGVMPSPAERVTRLGSIPSLASMKYVKMNSFRWLNLIRIAMVLGFTFGAGWRAALGVGNDYIISAAFMLLAITQGTLLYLDSNL